ncbi:MAG: ribonucleoside-triphosphate reductase [Candidatus Bathyarchaeia archaeon]|nr:ribonucleoside-triphosphate reductase [Candidatus Bathyarchaeota archaeon]
MLREKLLELSKSFPEEFREERDGTLKLEFKVAERKVFLTKKTLAYIARLRIDEPEKTVRFYEMLKETGMGLSSGDLEATPGIGFKVEKYKLTGKERIGTIEELSKLFGKEYKYTFDFSTIRGKIKQAAEEEGYTFSTVLSERSL